MGHWSEMGRLREGKRKRRAEKDTGGRGVSSSCNQSRNSAS